jgi:CheY-like chemotaxis protein
MVCNMHKLRVLYFDDEEEQLKMFKKSLESDWNELQPDVPIEVVPVLSVQDALNQLTDAKDAFQLLVSDLLVPTQPPKQGLWLIKEARRQNSKLAIVAVSIGNGQMAKEATDAGADYVLAKQTLIGDKDSLFGHTVLRALRDHRHEPIALRAAILVTPERSLALTSLLERVGVEHILNFCSRITRRPLSKVSVFLIRPGLSGASVLRADCDVAVAPDQPAEVREILLKMSSDERLLKGELGVDITNCPNTLFVPLFETGPIPSGEWFCIAGPFKRGAKTLLDWVRTESRGVNKIRESMNRLLSSQVLGDLYTRCGTLKNRTAVGALWDQLGPGRRARIDESLDRLSTVVGRHDPLKWYDRSLISEFLATTKRVGKIEETDFPEEVTTCWTHGDLHSRNVLIDHVGQPFLVDRANVGTRHWASDVARLAVDLILSGWDDAHECYEWDRMESWCEVIEHFLNATSLPGPAKGSPNAQLYASLTHLRESVSQLRTRDAQHFREDWEFELALATEFMRSSYRLQELPPPKQALSLIGACACMRRCRDNFRVWKQRMTP